MTTSSRNVARTADPALASIDLRHLEQFLAVVEQGSFRGASRVLNVAQPALSRNVRLIEERLGVTLFERSRQGVRATWAGITLAEGARKLRGDAADLVSRTVRAERGTVGELRVGYTDFSIAGTLPRIIKAFRSRYPDVTLTFMPLVTGDQIGALRSGAIDVGFLTGPVRRADFAARVVQTDRLVAVVPVGHPLAEAGPIRIRALAEEAFVVGEQRGWAHFLAHVNALCQKHGFLPRIVQEAKDSGAVLGLVAAGIGVTLSIERLAARGVPGCVWLDIADSPIEIETLLVRLVRGSNPVVDNFVAVAAELAGAT